ncbi:NAD(P)/FAD-dependent oxidoreductase [Halodesulfovibrio marinisediminis]|uniref:Thioredoxin reductase (NADPH) n=1 Tax=Halodesulfovibrio marinisediminis DSM 17456 TaxID=1121457 RepID=A0A1N6IKG1_9BACT|nr:FAD-dependent oxidoreductase [Halodesulfovibrio marinisediminis]SIO32481.1 thioredoxin reductase (NADPH) [Halodesulfovibrio marinisediminis DSM 17456]
MNTTYDLIILGGGVAGMTSAIYAARANLRVLILDENACGGLVNWTKVIENMPSYTSIGGMELVERIQEQVEALGVDIEEAACIDSIDLTGEEKVIEADDIVYKAKAVIVATGRKPIPLEVAGECENVHFCAICDGAAYKDKKVLVVGGGNSGFDEGIALLDQGIKELLLIEQMDKFFAAQHTQDELTSRDNARAILSTEVTAVNCEEALQSVTLRNVATGESTEYKCDGIFVFMGQKPGTEIFEGQLKMDKDGYIETDELMATSLTGVFAAGDVRPKKYRQITTAMGDGTIAALEAERYIRSLVE